MSQQKYFGHLASLCSPLILVVSLSQHLLQPKIYIQLNNNIKYRRQCIKVCFFCVCFFRNASFYFDITVRVSASSLVDYRNTRLRRRAAVLSIYLPIYRHLSTYLSNYRARYKSRARRIQTKKYEDIKNYICFFL